MLFSSQADSWAHRYSKSQEKVIESAVQGKRNRGSNGDCNLMSGLGNQSNDTKERMLPEIKLVG